MGACHLPPAEPAPEPAAPKARGAWHSSQEQGPRANRFLITAYSAGFLLWPGQRPIPSNTSSPLSACSELILGAEPCLIHRLSCNSRSGSSHLQMEAPLCSWRRPGSPLSEPFSHPPSLALLESETRPSSQEPHCPAWPVPHGPLHSPEQFHNHLLLDFPIWIKETIHWVDYHISTDSKQPPNLSGSTQTRSLFARVTV